MIELMASIIGKKIIHCDTVTSTNDVAEKMAKEGEPEGTVIVAARQTAGRGRLGRRWVSREGDGLWATIILRPVIDPRRVPLLTLAMALSIRQTLEGDLGVPASVKWPNDVLIRGRKVSGILAEAVWPPIPGQVIPSTPPGTALSGPSLAIPSLHNSGGYGVSATRAGSRGESLEHVSRPDSSNAVPGYVILGFGVNTCSPDELKALVEEVRTTSCSSCSIKRGNLDFLEPTSVTVEVKRKIEPSGLLRRILAEFETRYFSLRDQSTMIALLDEWRKHDIVIGSEVLISLPNGGQVHGTAAGIADDGTLLLKCEDEGQIEIRAGDVSVRLKEVALNRDA